VVSGVSAIVYVFGILGMVLGAFFVGTGLLVLRHRRRRRAMLGEVDIYARDTTAINARRRRAISVLTVADLLTDPDLFDAATRRDRPRGGRAR
jgi:hypothetical protein